jgi:hypothetical protein
MTRGFIGFWATLACSVWLSGCNNCATLIDNVCEELGPADCALWKEAKGPEMMTSGTRPERFCLNQRFRPGSTAVFVSAGRKIADAMRKGKAAQEKAKAN